MNANYTSFNFRKYLENSNIFLRILEKVQPVTLTLLPLLFLSNVGNAAEFNVRSQEDLPDAIPGDTFCRADNGMCTLRAAVEEANSIDDSYTINLENEVYTLSFKRAGLVWPLVIQAACTIDTVTCTSGDNKITIKGRGRSVTTIRLEDGGSGRLVYVATNNVAELSDLTLANGNISIAMNSFALPGGGGGGAIKIGKMASAVLNRTNITSNDVRRDHGGAIHNSGTLYIQNSRLSGNKAMIMNGSPGGFGGAIYHEGDYLGIADTVIEDNEAINGGGIYVRYTNFSGQNDNASPRVVVNRSDIRLNKASGAGGGLYDAGSVTQLSDVTVVNNSASASNGDNFGGGGIYKTGARVTYNVSASTADRVARGAAIFSGAAGDQYDCQICHNGFSSTPNNGSYSEFGLVNKILYTMPPDDPGVCGLQCAVDVMSYLSQADPYDLRQAANPSDLRGSDWDGWRELKINGAQFEGNTADHCKTVPARIVGVSEEDVRVVPEGGAACLNSSPPSPPVQILPN